MSETTDRRPTGVPADYWEKAEAIWAEIGGDDDFKGKDRTVIARALMAEAIPTSSLAKPITGDEIMERGRQYIRMGEALLSDGMKAKLASAPPSDKEEVKL